MLSQRAKISIGSVATLLILVLVSFSGEPQYEICRHPNDFQTICESYHVIPYRIIKIVAFADGHEGFFALITGGAVAVFTLGLFLLGRKADQHFQVVERAYVKLSHHAPGVYWELPAAADARYENAEELPYWIRLDLRAKNFGKTPCDVKNICIAHKIVMRGEKLPSKPDYSSGDINSGQAFLVADDAFNFPVNIKIGRDKFVALARNEQWLYIYGYVEYADKFGELHRGAYARRYDRNIDGRDQVTFRTGQSLARNPEIDSRNNFIFADQPGYNSDITRRRDGTWPI